MTNAPWDNPTNSEEPNATNDAPTANGSDEASFAGGRTSGSGPGGESRDGADELTPHDDSDGGDPPAGRESAKASSASA